MVGDDGLPGFPSGAGGRIETSDSSIIVRRFSGPEALEAFLLSRPRGGTADVVRQAEAGYGTLAALLAAEGASFEVAACETIFFRNIRRDLNAVLGARERVLGAAGVPSRLPPVTLIEQPPLDQEAPFELSVWAVIPHRRQTWITRDVRATPRCGCAACSRARARLISLADHTSVYTGNVHGSGGSAFDEAYDMFCGAEDLLQAAGMSFRDVVRTWIYLRDIDHDYADLNRARREFFRHKGIELRPASTGVGGGLFPDAHDFSMSLYAVKSPPALAVRPMSTPLLAEPWVYGADFSRGLRIVEANKVALYVAGTASVDEGGRTAHPDNLEAQVDRMLRNISSLLGAEGASFRDVIAAVSYLKHPSDSARLRAVFNDHGFDGFPNALVEAPLCRPDLLCETEVVAALPLPHAAT